MTKLLTFRGLNWLSSATNLHFIAWKEGYVCNEVLELYFMMGSNLETSIWNLVSISETFMSAGLFKLLKYLIKLSIEHSAFSLFIL
jgi:hypothetical protein